MLTTQVLCHHLGSFKRVDHGEHYNEDGEFMHVRVGVGSNEPLVKKLVTNCDYPEPCEVSLKYERLKNFCYFRGRLDHDDHEYPEKIEAKQMKIQSRRCKISMVSLLRCVSNPQGQNFLMSGFELQVKRKKDRPCRRSQIDSGEVLTGKTNRWKMKTR